MPGTFFGKPYYTEVLVKNELTQARDLAMAERTFLATSKLSLTLAASSCAFFQKRQSDLDFYVSLSLSIGALGILCGGLWSYAHSLDGYIDDRIFHHPKSFIVAIVSMMLLVMLINWYQYLKLDALFNIFKRFN